MTQKRPPLTAFERIEIQMEAIVPLVRDLQRILGRQVVLDALRLRAKQLAEDARATRPEPGDPRSVERAIEMFGAGGALDYEMLELDAARASIDVRGCKYAEMMRRLDALDLGADLICEMDHAMAIGAGLHLERTQTCMQGASHCDFRYTPLRPHEGEEADDEA